MGDLTLIVSRRSDGGVRIHSQEIKGLVLSGDDPDLVFQDVWPAIQEFVKYDKYKNILLPEITD